jgi:integrase
VLNLHILPYLGGCRLRDITPMQIQAVMSRLAGKSKSLQSKALVHLRSIFKAAEENGLVAKSPVSGTLKAGGKKTPEKVALTPQESRTLLERVENRRAKTFLLTALHTGMRRGEILALKWEDIDFTAKVIHVRHNAVMGSNETTVSDELKTKAAKRDVPLSDELEACLLAQKENAHSPYVISMQNHKPLTRSSYKSMWRLIERELPGVHVTAHILRHTYITRLFEAGLDIKEIQYLAGHSTVEMTLRVYTHYDRVSREAQTAEKVREALRT